jgi:predicted nucleic-acid-binding protein
VTIALDTNVLLRIVLNDDAQQLGKVLARLETDVGYVQDTVLVELEWVLRSFYRFPVQQIVRVMTLLADNEDIQLEDADRLHAALDAYAKGMEFTDAFHVAGAKRHSGFLTFDKELVKRASRVFASPPVISP